MAKRRYRKTATCTVCESPFDTSKYSVAQTCSPQCRGALQRQKSELKFRLDAFDAWTPDMAYAFGLIFSDGNITKPKHGSWRLQFISTDPEQTTWFHGFVGNPNKISVVIPEPGMIQGCVINSTKTQYRSITASDTLVTRLRDLGIRPRKSKEANGLMQVPDAMVSHFLRGVCDGDGSVMFIKNAKMPKGKTLRSTIVCYPKKNRLFLSRLLQTLGVPHTVTEKTVRMDGSQAELFCKAIYEGDGVRLERKHRVWKRWCAMRADVGGLITERDPYEPLRGVRSQPWHRWFGQLPDRQIAKKTGKAVSTVALARKKLGIDPVPPAKKIAPRPWHSSVGGMPDSHVATKFGISPATVLHYRRKMSVPIYTPSTPTWHALVGTVSDSALARQLGIDRSTVSNHRRRYGLPAARSL